MNKDQAKGAAKDVAGRAQEKLGEMTDNEETQAKGEARQLEGKTQKKAGDVKEGVKAITRKP